MNGSTIRGRVTLQLAGVEIESVFEGRYRIRRAVPQLLEFRGKLRTPGAVLPLAFEVPCVIPAGPSRATVVTQIIEQWIHGYFMAARD